MDSFICNNCIAEESQTYLSELSWRERGILCALNDPLDEVKILAISDLITIGRAEKIPQKTISHLLESHNLKLRLKAIEAFRYTKQISSDNLLKLIEILKKNKNPIILDAVSQTLCTLAQNDTLHDIVYSIENLINIDSNDTSLIKHSIKILCNIDTVSDELFDEILKFTNCKNLSIKSEAIISVTLQKKHANKAFKNLLSVLKNEESQRVLVMESLYKLYPYCKNFDTSYTNNVMKQMRTLLNSDNHVIQFKAVRFLIAYSDKIHDRYREILFTVLRHDEPESIKIEASNQLIELGKSNDFNLFKKLDSYLGDNILCYDVLKIISEIGFFPERYVQTIINLLHSDDIYLKKLSIYAIHKLDSGEMRYNEHIKPFLFETENEIKKYAIMYFRKYKNISCSYIENNLIPTILNTNILPDERNNALDLLGEFGCEYGKLYSKVFVKLIKSENPGIKVKTIEVSRRLCILSDSILELIANELSSDSALVRKEALISMGLFKESSKKYISQISKLLVDNNPYVRNEASRSISEMHQLSIDDIPLLLYPIYYQYSQLSGQIRYMAHYLGGGKNDIECLLSRIGFSQYQRSQLSHKILTRNETKHLINILNNSWKCAMSYKNLQVDIENQILDILCINKATWKIQDLPFLVKNLKLLEKAGSTHLDAIRYITKIITIKKWCIKLLYFVIIHVIFWLVLLFLYPRYTTVRAFFFWNPFVRKIMGMFYVSLLLTWVPFIRKRLFLPFKDHLTADPGLHYFKNQNFYQKLYVLNKYTNQKILLKKAIPDIRKQIVLEGESGTGKTMFAYYLLQHTGSITVYLRAENCGNGVIDAIKSKIQGIAIQNDDYYFEKLISFGAINICIDGFSEVTAETRIKISNFIEKNSDCNVLILTQPINWVPPRMADFHVLQPIHNNQVSEFLKNQEQNIHDIIRQDVNYPEACENFAKNVDFKKDKEIFPFLQDVISNPMDLFLISQLLATGQKPNVFDLQQQIFSLMKTDYEPKLNFIFNNYV